MRTSGLSMPRFSSLLCFVFLFSFVLFANAKPNGKQTAAMKGYIEKTGKAPSQYIIDSFKKNDAVILSQFNNLKHEVDFVASILPALYNEGITNLAMEYGNSKDQPLVDELLLSKESFDETKARTIMRNFKEYGIWGYQEYLSLFRQAWIVNRDLKGKDKKFRIILLGGSEANGSGRTAKFASIIESQILSKNEKALVYISACHGGNCSKNSFSHSPLKNYFQDKYKGKVFSVALHSPWIYSEDNTSKSMGLTRPLDGSIDEVIEKSGNTPVGFDISESPFKDICDTKSIYSGKDSKLSFGSIFDGYIYLLPYSEYEPLTWIEDFIDESNFLEIKKYFRGINSELKIETIEYANDLCRSSHSTVLSKARMLSNVATVKLNGNLN